jgi:hypothetical protein
MQELNNIDLRVLTGKQARGDQPIMVRCPFHDDTDASLGVYGDHAHCFAPDCKGGRFVRRYALAALLLGLWDGKEEGELDGVRTVKGKLASGGVILPSSTVQVGRGRVKQTDEEVEQMAATFHRYLMSDKAIDATTGVSMMQFLKEWRGYNEPIIREYRLGWTGTHFAIPVPSASGAVRAIRYRPHPVLIGFAKYEGLAGRNAPCLFSLPHVAKGTGDALWITEGEFDHIATVQLGGWSVTITNGAGSLNELPAQFSTLSIAVNEWVVATDNDEAGEQAAWELAMQLPHPLRAYWSVGKDINAYMLAGGDLPSVRLERMHKRSFHPLDKSQKVR